jgi:hypothetical protein
MSGWCNRRAAATGSFARLGVGPQDDRESPARSAGEVVALGVASGVGQPNMLVTDDAREAAAGVVRQALAEGSLTVEEAEPRLDAAYAARRQHELSAVLADLPQGRLRLPEWTARGGVAPRRWSGFVPFAPVLAAAVLTLALLGAHAVWPIFPLTFVALRVLWWRRGHSPYRTANLRVGR